VVDKKEKEEKKEIGFEVQGLGFGFEV